MKNRWTVCATACVFLLIGLAGSPEATGNGGPFVVKYPGGDPAAKGVLARLDPSLKPGKETRLRVVEEELGVTFGREAFSGAHGTPLAEVSAVYTIENPTGEEIKADFGFPILRGIYLIGGMSNTVVVEITADKEAVKPILISNSVLFGMIRHSARDVIENAILRDPELSAVVAPVRGAWTVTLTGPPEPEHPFGRSLLDVGGPKPEPKPTPERRPTAAWLPAREKMRDHLTAKLGWNPRDAALMVEYASLEFPAYNPWWREARDKWDWRLWTAHDLEGFKTSNLGPLAAIGEQKATQLFAHLASRFDRKAGSTYEEIFAAWGGDVRERSVDLATGGLRAREITLPSPAPMPKDGNESEAEKAARDAEHRLHESDPTVYARVDYLDPNMQLSPSERLTCEGVLKNLPVTFTFAPMNLLYYQVTFPAHATRRIAVAYQQYAYQDTQGTGSYQLAYVLHPATMWKEFGQIHLTVRVPKGVRCGASAAIKKTGEQAVAPPSVFATEGLRANALVFHAPLDVYEAILTRPEEKRGELFIGLDKAAWETGFRPPQPRDSPSQAR
jgi:hypothetical protein